MKKFFIKLKKWFTDDTNVFLFVILTLLLFNFICCIVCLSLTKKTANAQTDSIILTDYQETITDDNFYRYTYYGLDDFRSYNSYTFRSLFTTDGVVDLTHDFRTLAINPTGDTQYYDNLNINNSEMYNNRSETVYLKTNTYYFIKVNYIMTDTIHYSNEYELFIHNKSWSSQLKYQLYNFVDPLPNYDYDYNRVFLFNTSLFDNKDYYYDNGVIRQVQTYTLDNIVYYPFIISNTYGSFFNMDFSIYEILDFPLDYFSGVDTGVEISYSINPTYETAYQTGRELGYNNGYTLGYNTGYNQGIYDNNNYTFLNLIGAVIDAPITAFKGLLNFDFLGFNMLAFIEAILSIMFIIFIIKIILGGN